MNRNDFFAAIEDGQRFKYLYFWGHHPRLDGEISKTCFSQWWELSPFEVEGIRYATAEHFMMAEKARLFEDIDSCEKIISSTHPGEAKKFGREVEGFDEEKWAEARFDIVVKGNLAKFKQDEKLRSFLVKTKNRILVEASPFDQIWGIGMTADDPKIVDPALWQGLNLLGFALMVVRQKLLV